MDREKLVEEMARAIFCRAPGSDMAPPSSTEKAIAARALAVAEAAIRADERRARSKVAGGWRPGYENGWVLVRPDGMLLWNSRYKPSEEEIEKIADAINYWEALPPHQPPEQQP